MCGNAQLQENSKGWQDLRYCDSSFLIVAHIYITLDRWASLSTKLKMATVLHFWPEKVTLNEVLVLRSCRRNPLFPAGALQPLLTPWVRWSRVQEPLCFAAGVGRNSLCPLDVEAGSFSSFRSKHWIPLKSACSCKQHITHSVNNDSNHCRGKKGYGWNKDEFHRSWRGKLFLCGQTDGFLNLY